MISLKLMIPLLLMSAGMAGFARAGDGFVPVPSDAEAWAKLPKAVKGGDQPLPSWARMTAGYLPRSTAAFLQLDLAQRTKSPVDPKLRAAMRWVAAHANKCSYAEAYAAADAVRAGLEQSKLEALGRAGYPGWSESEKAALEFARKMTVDSDGVTDAEFATLVKNFGERQAASMVLLLAFSNFQDRFLISLGAAVEPGGPLAPLDVSFEPSSLTSRTTPPPPRQKTALPKPTGSDLIEDGPEWTTATYEQLQDKLEAQRRKPTRLRVPSWDEVAKNLPDGFMKRPSDIVWYRIVFGYAPELAVPFEIFMRTAGAEAAPKFDRIFGGSLFWVVTKAIKCPYCMGHCEMNWEVAGLNRNEIAERSRVLAGNDWSSFPEGEQHALAFARKLTAAPSSISTEDTETLKKDFGVDRAMIVMLNASRYNYMTRISNGFQLTLERDNVFFDYYNAKPQSAPAVDAASLANDEAVWKRLPATNSGGGGPLPNWVKAVSDRLPRTAAAMLTLDLAQRTKSPLDPVLRAKMRWVIARANRCDYSEAYALADLKRAGADDATIKTLTGGREGWPDADRDPLEFARLHTVAAPTITDDLFNRLRQRFGDKKIAAMVLLGAYGNFQDRIVLGLNLPLEPKGPLAPIEVEFDPKAMQTVPLLPEPSQKVAAILNGVNLAERDPEWSELSFDELQSRLEKQRARECRLPIPTWDDVKKNLPPTMAARPTRIVWNLVCSGYVPELAIPWSVATRTMWAEAKPDRIFEESLFWIQTRAIRCNYCMGHCEMLMEVGGLSKAEIADRTKRLASDDWSSFPPAEQRAYAYARKLSKTPWELTRADYEALEKDQGSASAMATFWWLCRGLYMTRISDGFQLPLERDNVFMEFFKAPADSTRSGTK
jgi:alkylhydroperoxidase family enzyme